LVFATFNAPPTAARPSPAAPNIALRARADEERLLRMAITGIGTVPARPPLRLEA
jgi:hypothetical protein